MKKIIVIGTLHAGLTPENELEEVLEKYNSDQIFVEITQEEIAYARSDSLPFLTSNQSTYFPM